MTRLCVDRVKHRHNWLGHRIGWHYHVDADGTVEPSTDDPRFPQVASTSDFSADDKREHAMTYNPKTLAAYSIAGCLMIAGASASLSQGGSILRESPPPEQVQTDLLCDVYLYSVENTDAGSSFRALVVNSGDQSIDLSLWSVRNLIKRQVSVQGHSREPGILELFNSIGVIEEPPVRADARDLLTVPAKASIAVFIHFDHYVVQDEYIKLRRTNGCVIEGPLYAYPFRKLEVLGHIHSRSHPYVANE